MTDTIEEMLSTFEERWRNLTIKNDFVFCKAMLDTELCREVIEAILDMPIERVEYAHSQEQIDTTLENKSVRLDVYVRDEAGTVFDVEMQSTDTFELPQRSRYYRSLLTLDQLSRGVEYKALKDTYVIFICGFDLFKCGRRVYYFENTCRDDHSIKLGDKERTIFLAATAPSSAEDGEQLNELLDYVATGKVKGELSAKLASAVAEVLNNQKWRLEYMILEVRDQLNFDRGVIQGRAEGLAQGIEIGEERLSKLIAMLAKDGRIEEVVHATSDTKYLAQLYEDYGIS